MKDFSDTTLLEVKQDFLNYMTPLLAQVDELVKERFALQDDLREYILDIIRYNVVGGKMIRGLFAVYSAYALCEEWNEEMKEQAFVVGWCAEMLQASFLIMDDIMDEGEMRRGKPAWYKLPNIGMTSINDAILLHSLIFELLKNKISDQQRCDAVITTIQRIMFATEIGQMLDLHTIHPTSHQLIYENFTEAYYTQIITNKTAYYTICMPIYLGLVLTGYDKTRLHSPTLREVCLHLGRFFQVRDDYLDVFADPSVLGKEGTDIQEGKCSWVILTALSMCSREEEEELKQNYGRKESACVARVREIFSRYDIHSKYRSYEQAAFETVNKELESEQFPVPELLPVFRVLMEKLFGRH